jgi:hypothetical protein
VFVKVLGIVSLLVLPLSALLWHKSHSDPFQRRLDVTLYKSLNVYLKDGSCGLHLLSMPTKTASRSESHAPLARDARPGKRNLLLSSKKEGPYRRTWLVFPLWLPTSVCMTLCCLPVIRGPVREWHRKRNGLCLYCGYNLTGNQSGRCPECGMRITRARSRPRRTRPSRSSSRSFRHRPA